MAAQIMMDFQWDGVVRAIMDGVSTVHPEVEAELSYRIHASVTPEGHWTPDGLGGPQGYVHVEETFFLVEEEGELVYFTRWCGAGTGKSIFSL